MTDERTVTTGETAALLCSQESVAALLAEIDRLRERQSSADMCLDAVTEARRVLREHFGGNLAFLDDDLVRGVVKMKEEIDRLTRERDEARAEREVIARAFLELHATVVGECPSLLDEDSGGSAVLIDLVDAALAQIGQERSEQAKEGTK